MTTRSTTEPRNEPFAIAPMMDWTDRHCRFFHRLLTRRALLYTEMVVAEAVIHGDRARLLGFDAVEHPLAVQLGGSDPARLAEAARICADHGYDEINLNVGCPSDRVQSGTFGACLMREPALVGRCVAAMTAAVDVPVTVKCRLGVDDQETGPALDELAQAVWAAGASGLWVHARKAWLEGLSPKENRDVPPLDYDRVRQLKAANRDRFIGLNGGLGDLRHALAEMDRDGVRLDGVMLGRAAYQTPGILADADAVFFGDPAPPITPAMLVEAMAAYIDRHVKEGGRANHVTRHMVGLFHGQPGARRWRQILSVEAVKPDADGSVLREAFSALEEPHLGDQKLRIDGFGKGRAGATGTGTLARTGTD